MILRLTRLHRESLSHAATGWHRNLIVVRFPRPGPEENIVAAIERAQ